MTQFDGKTIAVAGKLAQRYASRSNNLPADLRRVGATLLEGFDVDADLFVMASKSKGFAKRVAKTGKPCITEAELEDALQEALRMKDAASPRTPKRKTYNVVHELQTCRAPSLSPVARRQSLIEVLCEARGHGVDVGFGGLITPSDAPSLPEEPSAVVACRVFVWARFREVRIYALPHDVASEVLEDLRRVSRQPFYFGEDCPNEALGAGCRTLVRMGDDPEELWARMLAEYDLRDPEPRDRRASTLADLQVLPVLERHRITDLEALDFAVSELITVRDLVQW